MYGLFWEFRQSQRIGQAEAEAERGRSKAAEARREAQDVDARLDKLTLACMAMWELVKEKTGLTEEDLMERVRQIDLSDGRLDGKIQKQIARCPKCDHVMSARHQKCMYCGATKLDAKPFDSAL